MRAMPELSLSTMAGGVRKFMLTGYPFRCFRRIPAKFLFFAIGIMVFEA